MASATAESTLPNTPYTKRAVYLTPSNGFKTKLPQVPKHVFLDERDRALDPATGTTRWRYFSVPFMGWGYLYFGLYEFHKQGENLWKRTRIQ